MKVLCFGRFSDEIPGGMQRHVEHLLRSLRGEVEFVHLVPSRTGTGAVSRVEGVPVVKTASLNLDGSLALSPNLIFGAKDLQRRYEFDLIHLHFPDPMSHLASMVLPRSVPRVITWHADIQRYPLLLPLYRPLLRQSLRQAAAVVAATPYHVSCSSELGRLKGSERLHIVPFGFDLAPFAKPHASVARIKKRFPGRLIFALGRHVYYKGFDVLIRALSQLSSDVQLLIGGVGPLTAQWKALAVELGVADRVQFIGLIDDAELPAWYQACDVFCLPAVSPAEAFGIVQVEAMAAGRPVISSDLDTGVRYVNRHGETGLITPPGDVRALAGALQRVLDDDALRQRLGRRAAQWAASEFGMEAMRERMLAVYRQARDSHR